jgi:ABC-2 type transport system permease protein
MNKSVVVAKWEYLEKVKSKSFIIGLFITPIMMVVMGVLPGFLASKEDESSKVIGVIDATGLLDSALSVRMERYNLSNGLPNYLLQPIASGAGINVIEATTDADKRVTRDDLEGYIVLGPNAMTDSVVEYRSKAAGDFRLIGRLEENLRSILSERKFAEHGIDAGLMNELRVPMDVRTVKISSEG